MQYLDDAKQCGLHGQDALSEHADLVRGACQFMAAASRSVCEKRPQPHASPNQTPVSVYRCVSCAKSLRFASSSLMGSGFILLVCSAIMPCRISNTVAGTTCRMWRTRLTSSAL